MPIIGPATPTATPTAQANAAISATPVKASTSPQDNNIAATQAANASYAAANPNIFGAPSTASGSLPVSTTTLSNQNKINQVGGIQTTTSNLANTGLSTNQNGVTTYANGEVYNPPATQGQVDPNSQVTTTGTLVNGGYTTDGLYYAPGAVAPKDANGNAINLTPQDPVSTGIINQLNQQKVQTDANTAQLISNIQANYASLIEQQKIVNSSQAAGANNNRLMGGVTGQGSTAQFASKTSNSVFTSVLNQGIQALGALQTKENDAIVQAQIAGENQDWQIMDKINGEIEDIRSTKQAAAQKINDTIQDQYQKQQDELKQQVKDNFVASQLDNGVSDPQAILKAAKDAGLTLTAKEVSDSMASLSPDKDQIQSIAASAAQAGADAATVAKIAGAKDFNSAIALATPALGAKVANDIAQQKFENDLALKNYAINQAQASISRANLALSQQKEAFDEAVALAKANGGQVTLDAKGKPVVGPAVAPVQQQALAKANIDLINSLTTDKGLNSAVGPNYLARFSVKNELSGVKSNFIAGVQQLTSQLSLKALEDAKASGATFGALSEGELNVLSNSATKLNQWAIKDKSGNVTGYNANESNFRTELDKINNFAKLDYVLKGGSPTDVGIVAQPDGTYWTQNSDGSLTELK